MVSTLFLAANLCAHLFRRVSPPLGFRCGRDGQVHSIYLRVRQCVLLEDCKRSESKARANILHILVLQEPQLVLPKSIPEWSQMHRIAFNSHRTTGDIQLLYIC